MWSITLIYLVEMNFYFTNTSIDYWKMAHLFFIWCFGGIS